MTVMAFYIGQDKNYQINRERDKTGEAFKGNRLHKRRIVRLETLVG